MDLSLDNRHALVGGASRGIGRATAIELALNGASVTCIARNEENLKTVVAALHCGPDQSHRYIVGDSAYPARLAQQVSLLATAQPIHILINNTGGPPDGLAHTAGEAEYLAAFTQHVLCNQSILQAVLGGMRAAGYGRIINVISTSVKQPIPGLGVSNTIRAAVAAWAKTLASELGPDGITVNNVLPGFTETDRLDDVIAANARRADQSIDETASRMKAAVPLRRFGQPHETAAAIAFLASPAAAYINGINLPVDGGRTASL